MDIIKNYYFRLRAFLSRIKATIFDEDGSDKFIISIVDDKGTRQFSVHKEAKKILIGLLLVIISIVLAWLITTRFLLDELEIIAKDKQIVQENFINTYRLNEQYSKEIQSKIKELSVVSSKIQNLEGMLDIQKSSDDLSIMDKNKKIDFEQIDEGQKKIILNIIPNGESVTTYTKKEVIQKRQRGKNIQAGYIYKSPVTMSIYATADGIVESINKENSKNYGNYVKITHSFGFSSVYGYMGDIRVKVGDFVSKGQIIGFSVASNSEYKSYYEARFLGLYLNADLYSKWNVEDFSMISNDESGIDWDGLIKVMDGLRILKNYRDDQVGQIQNNQN